MSDSREAFEAWLSKHCDYDDLNKSEIELARDAWQAATELAEHKTHSLECIIADLRAELEAERGPVGWVHQKHLKHLQDGHPVRVYHADTPVVFDTKVALYTHPAPPAAPDVGGLVDALESVLYCNEVGFLPNSVQNRIAAALSAHREQQGDVQ